MIIKGLAVFPFTFFAESSYNGILFSAVLFNLAVFSTVKINNPDTNTNITNRTQIESLIFSVK